MGGWMDEPTHAVKSTPPDVLTGQSGTRIRQKEQVSLMFHNIKSNYVMIKKGEQSFINKLKTVII